MDLRRMTLDELKIYYAAVEAYGSPADLYKVAEVLNRKKEEEYE